MGVGLVPHMGKFGVVCLVVQSLRLMVGGGVSVSGGVIGEQRQLAIDFDIYLEFIITLSASISQHLQTLFHSFNHFNDPGIFQLQILTALFSYRSDN